jgi:hypothetical protein
VCVVCGGPIDGVRERWIVEHIRALELGGADGLSNMQPAHEVCAVEKTREDHRRAARAKRQKIRHLGANEPKRPLPFGKTSRWKRTLSGKVVPRVRRGRELHRPGGGLMAGLRMVVSSVPSGPSERGRSQGRPHERLGVESSAEFQSRMRCYAVMRGKRLASERMKSCLSLPKSRRFAVLTLAGSTTTQHQAPEPLPPDPSRSLSGKRGQPYPAGTGPAPNP